MKATTHVKEKDWILDLSECDPACNAESAATRSLRTKAEAFISGEWRTVVVGLPWKDLIDRPSMGGVLDPIHKL